VRVQYPALVHLHLAAIQISEQLGQRGFQECWGSAVSWLTSISATIAFVDKIEVSQITSTSSMVIVKLFAEGPTHAAAAESLKIAGTVHSADSPQSRLGLVLSV
jgi:hypothetical protein